MNEVDYQDVLNQRYLVDSLGLNEEFASALCKDGSGYNLSVKRMLIHRFAYATAYACKINYKGDSNNGRKG